MGERIGLTKEQIGDQKSLEELRNLRDKRISGVFETEVRFNNIVGGGMSHEDVLQYMGRIKNEYKSDEIIYGFALTKFQYYDEKSAKHANRFKLLEDYIFDNIISEETLLKKIENIDRNPRFEDTDRFFEEVIYLSLLRNMDEKTKNIAKKYLKLFHDIAAKSYTNIPRICRNTYFGNIELFGGYEFKFSHGSIRRELFSDYGLSKRNAFDKFLKIFNMNKKDKINLPR